ncbi:MAG: Na+/H+ antiporter NhaC family protein [Lachnospiraceae bacterium]|nr:Na+/H+ antiporter NhaC family protein [Lachnospiraceae bacterium]
MENSIFIATAWSLLPPVVAIVLAFITKEVYSSLFVGIVVGALLYGQFNPWASFQSIFTIMTENVDLNIIIFLIMLGMIVVLMEKSGGSAAYGRFAQKRIKSKKASLLATTILGMLIFVDDYFNCLTVGSVMRPVTDRYRVSRAKLAYIIDATAAPVCIIAPISSWAAAVNSYVPEDSGINGLQLFMSTIPFNLYALLTLFMVVYTSVRGIDFGEMARHERNAEKGDLFTSHAGEFEKGEKITRNDRGHVLDLILPILILIFSAIGAMIYTGYQEGAVNIQDAFANCDSEISLIFGTFVTLVFMLISYVPRKIVSFKEYVEGFGTGFQLMIPAISILTFAWTLKGVTQALDIRTFVSNMVGSGSFAAALVPVIMFLISIFIAFSTGTSWGTFAILVPIVISIFSGPDDLQMMIISVSAVLAGAVCGDHVSPISDTTIMSSAGAQCFHMNHVSTQMQYAFVSTGCCVIGYIVAGFTKNWLISLGLGLVLLIISLEVISKRERSKAGASS